MLVGVEMISHVSNQTNDEISLEAREALMTYGASAAKVITEQADTQLQQGNILGAFHQRLVVQAILDLEDEFRKP